MFISIDRVRYAGVRLRVSQERGQHHDEERVRCGSRLAAGLLSFTKLALKGTVQQNIDLKFKTPKSIGEFLDESLKVPLLYE